MSRELLRRTKSEPRCPFPPAEAEHAKLLGPGERACGVYFEAREGSDGGGEATAGADRGRRTQGELLGVDRGRLEPQNKCRESRMMLPFVSIGGSNVSPDIRKRVKW